jgi:hypothetical protein
LEAATRPTATGLYRTAGRLTAEEERALVSGRPARVPPARVGPGSGVARKRAREEWLRSPAWREWLASPERRTLIECNIPIALMIASPFRAGLGEDADGVALEWLCRAADAFDPGRGARFSTFAGSYIRPRLMQACLEIHATIKVPGDVRQFLSQLRADPDAVPRRPCVGSHVGEAMAASRMMTMVDDLTPGRALADVPAGAELDELAGRVREAVSRLSPDLAEVVREYHLCDGEDRPSLSEISRLHGFRRHRADRRLAEAYRLLRRDLAAARDD